MGIGKAQFVRRKRNVSRENCELLFFTHIHKSEQVLTSRRTKRRCVAAKKDPRITFQDRPLLWVLLPTNRPKRNHQTVKSTVFILLKIRYRLFSSISSVPSVKRKTLPTMPPVRTSRNRKPPPEGFDDIEDTLLEFSNKMKDAENAPHDGKKKHEMLWPIFQISHQRELTPYSPPAIVFICC